MGMKIPKTGLKYFLADVVGRCMGLGMVSCGYGW
jgi:hypothetical protein